MPRKPRFNIADLPQHIVQRGNNRQSCFRSESDFLVYLKYLRIARKAQDCRIHAFVLMTNHVHLLVTQSRPHGLSKMMQSLGRRYVRYFNDRYHRTGTLWEGRYRSSLVSNDSHLLACYRYIELNPVRANIVNHPREYRWSSYRSNSEGIADNLLSVHETYLSLGDNRETRCRNYRDLFTVDLDPTVISEIRRCANGDLVFGNDQFKDEIAQNLKRPSRHGKSGRPKKLRLKTRVNENPGQRPIFRMLTDKK